jgi:hypothetical protein
VPRRGRGRSRPPGTFSTRWLVSDVADVPLALRLMSNPRVLVGRWR